MVVWAGNLLEMALFGKNGTFWAGEALFGLGRHFLGWGGGSGPFSRGPAGVLAGVLGGGLGTVWGGHFRPFSRGPLGLLSGSEKWALFGSGALPWVRDSGEANFWENPGPALFRA